jgi:ribosomal protein S27AE
MKYRALCPHCGLRFSRRMSVMNVPHIRRHCPQCGKTFRAVAWSEYVGNIVLCVAWVLPILLARAEWLPWSAAIGLAVVVLALGIWSWPYVTIFERVAVKKTEDA